MKSRILVVEDDPLVAIMLEGYLDALDRQVVGCAEDIAGALRLIAGQGFEAAIIDVHLANGETSERVAVTLKAANIPFIVTTGSGANEEPAYVGAPLLTKPFTLSSLEAALAEIDHVGGSA